MAGKAAALPKKKKTTKAIAADPIEAIRKGRTPLIRIQTFGNQMIRGAVAALALDGMKGTKLPKHFRGWMNAATKSMTRRATAAAIGTPAPAAARKPAAATATGKTRGRPRKAAGPAAAPAAATASPAA